MNTGFDNYRIATLKSQIPDIPDIILTFSMSIRKKQAEFKKYKTNNNKNTFKMLKANIKRKL